MSVTDHEKEGNSLYRAGRYSDALTHYELQIANKSVSNVKLSVALAYAFPLSPLFVACQCVPSSTWQAQNHRCVIVST